MADSRFDSTLNFAISQTATDWSLVKLAREAGKNYIY
jgi:hypothetical protein